ncbi:MAG: patatin-like phospholipase family protein [Candidatus Margulisiibacteriota bacterium]
MLDKFLSVFLPRKKVGLALGGGVARALAHIGVLKVIERHKIPIHYIAGTSMGALIAALYAAGISPAKIERIAARTSWAQILRFSFSSSGPFSGEGIYRFMEYRLGKNKQFKDLKIPLRIVATDLKSGKPYVFAEGEVARAVQASATFPGVFLPVREKGVLLVDGGIVNNVPSSVVREMGANFVIAVDAVPKEELIDDPKNVLQVAGRAVDLILRKLSEEGRRQADILIEPDFDEDIWHLDLHMARQLIREGEVAAEKAIAGSPALSSLK